MAGPKTSAENEKQSVALSSVAAGLFLTLFKLGIGLWTGSLGILSEAAHSGLDFVAALITYIAVRVSDKPADQEHLYGHGKVENFSALIETLLLLITCGWIIYEAVHRLLVKDVEITVNSWSFIVIIIAIFVDIGRSRSLKKAAVKYSSQALEADALHFSTDIWSSAVVLIGLILAAFKINIADSIAALAVAVIVMVVTVNLARRTIDALMDRAPAGITERIQQLVLSIDGVQKVERIRVRPSGARTFVDMFVNVNRQLPLEVADQLIGQVETKVRESIPNSDVIVHTEPVRIDSESIVDQVRAAAANTKLMITKSDSHQRTILPRIHHIHVYRLNGDIPRYRTTLHIECDDTVQFREAAQLADAIKAGVIKEIPGILDVTIRINVRGNVVYDGAEATDQHSQLVTAIKEIMNRTPGVISTNEITILSVENALHATVTCLMDGSMNLEDLDRNLAQSEKLIYSLSPPVAEVTIATIPKSDHVKL